MDKVGRNDPCPCGSGKKYKQCCMAKRQPSPSSSPTMASLKARNISVKTVEKEAPELKQQIPQPLNLMERTFGSAVVPSQDDPQSLLEEQPFPPSKQPEGKVSGIEPPETGGYGGFSSSSS